MNKIRVEKFIPIAIECIKETKLLLRDGKIPNEFKGYVSNFGASIIQSGLLPTIAFFEKKDANSKEDRSKLLKVVMNVINNENNKEKDYSFDENLDMISYALKSRDNESSIKEKIIDATIAVKLAMGVFQFAGTDEVN